MRPEPKRLPSQERIPQLDGLRGSAIFLVILCHYVADVPHGTPHSLVSRIGTAFALGASGVDLFFVLSGFLIGGILLDSRDSPTFYRTFYLRRFHRIFPLYYSWIVLFLLISLVSVEFRVETSYWVYFTFLQNYFFKHSGIELVWFDALWSLGVEEQFYLLAPPLIRYVSRRQLIRVLLAVLALAPVLRLFLALAFGQAYRDFWGIRAANLWMPSRADALAIGVLIAVAWRNDEARGWIVRHVSYFRSAILISFALILVTLYWLVKPASLVRASIGISIFGLLYSSLLVLSLANADGTVARACRWIGLRELGRVSYCVYIIHDAVNWGVHRIVRRDVPRFDTAGSIAVTFLAFAATLFLARLSWILIERPLIRRGHRYVYIDKASVEAT